MIFDQITYDVLGKSQIELKYKFQIMASSTDNKDSEHRVSFSGRVNDYRRKIMQQLTKNIGKSNAKKAVTLNSNSEIKKVLIIRPNHRLGNLLLITPLLQDVTETFPDCKIDILTKGNLAPFILENYKNIDGYIVLPRKPFKQLITYVKVWLSVKFKTYDLVINAVKGSSSGKLLTSFSNAKYKVFDELEEDFISKVPDSYHIAKNPVYNLRNYLSKTGLPKRDRPIPMLDMKLGSDEIDKGKSTLLELTKNTTKTICIYTFATGAKCYSKEWWDDFYKQLKSKFSEYNIVEILPIENVSQIDFKAPAFYSKDLREIASVIENTSLFIGGDCGIMHLAAATKTPVIGLFSNSKIEKYKPYGNTNMAIDTDKSSIMEIIKAAELAVQN